MGNESFFGFAGKNKIFLKTGNYISLIKRVKVLLLFSTKKIFKGVEVTNNFFNIIIFALLIYLINLRRLKLTCILVFGYCIK